MSKQSEEENIQNDHDENDNEMSLEQRVEWLRERVSIYSLGVEPQC
jgi:hypothetical protein